jgi:acetoin:2,6-dichlorophenolindophenol oxidoreductase subunit alpha
VLNHFEESVFKFIRCKNMRQEGKMSMKPKKDKLMRLLVLMLRAKMLEERAIKLFTDGQSPGWIHAGRGQEAIGAGVCVDLLPTDIVFPTHRGRSASVAKGIDFKRSLAELCGKATGVSEGRNGYDYLSDKKLGLYNFFGPIGAMICVATGVALSHQIQRLDGIVVCFFGDGAANHGTFHECLNVASLWKLPILYVCENNGWAQFTAQEWTTSVTDVSKKAAGYNMPGLTVNGNDVLAVYEAATTAIERARQGGGPTLLEGKTKRWYGHYIGDPQKYRAKEDVEQVPKFDPIPAFVAKLISDKVATQAEIQKIEEEISRELDEAEKFALESPLPKAETAFRHVYWEGGTGQ